MCLTAGTASGPPDKTGWSRVLLPREEGADVAEGTTGGRTPHRTPIISGSSPRKCWESLRNYLPSLGFIYRKGGPGHLKGMLRSKILVMRYQDSHADERRRRMRSELERGSERGQARELFPRRGLHGQIVLQQESWKSDLRQDYQPAPPFSLLSPEKDLGNSPTRNKKVQVWLFTGVEGHTQFGPMTFHPRPGVRPSTILSDRDGVEARVG